MVRGIGPHFARKLVRAFAEQAFDIIEQEPERLLELEGIGPKRRERVAECLDAVSELTDETLEALASGEIG